MSRVVASPIPITSAPIRARLEVVKAEMSKDMQRRFGRDATWNEVAERLLDAYRPRALVIVPHDDGTSYCTGIPGGCPIHGGETQ